MSFALLDMARFLTVLLAVLLILGVAGWGGLAIYYSNIKSSIGRWVLIILFGFLSLAALAGVMMRQWAGGRIAIASFLIAFMSLVILWSTVKPSNSRDWQPEVDRLATATVAGDLVTVRNIRNLDYRTETDFTTRYYNRTYDLNQLDSVDLLTVYWMGPAIAHTFLSFGFAGNEYIAISIEMRKEKGETYSAIKGMFKQFELYYVVADERDVIRVRTNFRNPEEQVYLYRIKITNENARMLFLNYIKSINRLAEQPKFYHTLNDNCTTNILLHARVFPNKLKYNWRIILSGFAAKYLYELGGIDNSLPFDELKRRSLINGRAHEAHDADDFSQRIRQGLPWSDQSTWPSISSPS